MYLKILQGRNKGTLHEILCQISWHNSVGCLCLIKSEGNNGAGNCHPEKIMYVDNEFDYKGWNEDHSDLRKGHSWIEPESGFYEIVLHHDNESHIEQLPSIDSYE